MPQHAVIWPLCHSSPTCPLLIYCEYSSPAVLSYFDSPTTPCFLTFFLGHMLLKKKEVAGDRVGMVSLAQGPPHEPSSPPPGRKAGETQESRE